MILYKDNSLTVKDVDTSKGIVKAYYSAYGNEDSDGDIIMRGAATKSAKERGPGGTNRIKHFKNHRSDQVPGVILELGEDEKGGWFVSKLMQHNGEFTQLAKDTLIEYQAGGITEHSHGLEIMKSHEDNGKQIITELKLWEVSSLSAWGANPQTPTVNVKSEKDALKTMEHINGLLKIGDFSDDYLIQLEKRWNEINNFLQSLKQNEPPTHSKEDEPTREINLVELFKSV